MVLRPVVMLVEGHTGMEYDLLALTELHSVKGNTQHLAVESEEELTGVEIHSAANGVPSQGQGWAPGSG